MKGLRKILHQQVLFNKCPSQVFVPNINSEQGNTASLLQLKTNTELVSVYYIWFYFFLGTSFISVLVLCMVTYDDEYNAKENEN